MSLERSPCRAFAFRLLLVFDQFSVILSNEMAGHFAIEDKREAVERKAFPVSGDGLGNALKKAAAAGTVYVLRLKKGESGCLSR